MIHKEPYIHYRCSSGNGTFNKINRGKSINFNNPIFFTFYLVWQRCLDTGNERIKMII
jgi:hypothetical protein